MVGVDEFSFVSVTNFAYVQLPMALEGDGILFGISTRSSGGDMEPLIEACKKGEGPYEFYERMPICEECLLFDSNQQKELCPHMGHVRQAWGDDKRKKTSSHVSKLLDLQGAHAQENLNIVENISRKFFNPVKIDEAFKQDNHVDFRKEIPQVVYVGIDPANAGPDCFLSGAAFWHYTDRHDVVSPKKTHTKVYFILQSQIIFTQLVDKSFEF